MNELSPNTMSSTIDKCTIITFSIVNNSYPCHPYMFVNENYSSKFMIMSFSAPALNSFAENGIHKKISGYITGGSQKLLQGLVSHELKAYLSVFDQFLTQWIMAILSKGCRPDKFQPHNSLKLSFTNIWRLRFNFVECESFLGSNSPDIFAPCKTNLDDSIDSGNFSLGVIFL